MQVTPRSFKTGIYSSGLNVYWALLFPTNFFLFDKGPLKAINFSGIIHERSPFSSLDKFAKVLIEKLERLKCFKSTAFLRALQQSSTEHGNVFIENAASLNGINGGNIPTNGPYAYSMSR